MSEINVALSLRRRQAQVFRCPKRFIVVVAGRRWGKTTVALWWLIVNAFSGMIACAITLPPRISRSSELRGQH